MLNPKESKKVQEESQISNLTEAYRKAVPYINIVYVLIGSLFMLGAAGWFADKYCQTKPALTILGIFLGLGVGFYNFFKSLQQLEKNNK